MTEPTDRDRLIAVRVADQFGGELPRLYVAIAEAIAAARAEERERCAKIALRSAQAQAAEDEYCCAGVAENIAARIRSGQSEPRDEFLDEARADHGPLIEAARVELVKLHDRRVAELLKMNDVLREELRKAAENYDRRAADLLRANNALLERARVAEDGMQWRPIETAPKDGSRILVLGTEGGIAIASWDPEGTSWADEHGNPCAAGQGSIQVTGIWSCDEDGWFQPNEARGWFPLPPAPEDGA